MQATSELGNCYHHIWQSWVEIKHYSVAYFDHVTAFKALQCRTSVEGRAHMCSVGA